MWLVGHAWKFLVSEMKNHLNSYRRLNSLKIILNPSTDSATAKWRFGRGTCRTHFGRLGYTVVRGWVGFVGSREN